MSHSNSNLTLYFVQNIPYNIALINQLHTVSDLFENFNVIRIYGPRAL